MEQALTSTRDTYRDRLLDTLGESQHDGDLAILAVSLLGIWLGDPMSRGRYSRRARACWSPPTS